MAPSSGSTAGGATVVLTGTNLTGATDVSFGATPASGFTVDSATQITATAPAGSAGSVNVTVTTPDGTSATGAGNAYTYVTPPSAPTVTAPADGSLGSDTTPDYSGTADASVTVDVIVDGVSVGTTMSSGGGAWSLTQPAPLSDGPHTVRATATVSGVTGPSSSTSSFSIDATPPAAPVVTSPAAGADTSTSPTIAGTAEALSMVSVLIDGGVVGTVSADGGGDWSYGASGLATSAHTVTARAADAAGNISPDSSTINFVARPPPSVFSVTANVGATAGGETIVISGSDFFTITGVLIGGVSPTSTTPINATTIEAVVPAHAAGVVNVTVTTAGGTSAAGAGNEYTYVDAPTVTSLSSDSGPTAGGNTVILIGTDFTSVATVAFGATAASFSVDSATQITATAPAGSIGMINVRVTAVGGQSATGAGNAYSYVAAPTVTSVSPNAGSTAGGEAIVLTGTDLTGATAVSFGATPAVSFTVDSATQITATAPAGSAGAVNVQVTTPGGQSATGAGNQYSYVAPPTVTSLSPDAGPLAGGGAVVLTGTGLTGATAVSFGATPAASFTVDSATQITATAPAGSAGAVNVRVTTPGGQSATAPGNQYSYASIPSVAAIAPNAGPTAGGTSVVLTGTGFTGASAVLFDGAAAAGFTIDSATQITATAPAGSAGTVHVTVTTPGGTSAAAASDQFTFIAPLVVTAGAASGTSVAGGYSQSNPASGGVGPYSYSVATGALPAGVGLDSATGAVTGTPTSAGAFSYAIAATDSQGTPATASGSTVSGAISQGAQTISFAPPSTAMLSATPMTLAATADSGLSVTFSSSTPAVCTASGALLTLLSEGACTVDADQAGDANWSAAATVSRTITIDPPAIPSVASAAAAVAFNTATTIDLGASITGAHTGIAIASPPAHGSASVAGDVVTYTPAADYIGSDSFDYTATGPGGASSPATVTLTVAAPPPPVAAAADAPAVSSVTEGGGSQTPINLSSLVSGTFTSIEIVTPPAHGTVALSTSTSTSGNAAALSAQSAAYAQAGPNILALYTPYSGYVGTDSFQFVAIGPGGTSAPATVTLTVIGSAPTASDLDAATLAGRPIDVTLTQGATEGPFTAAAVVSVEPGLAGTTLIREAGSGASRGFVLTFTPDDAFSGVAQIDYTLSNAWGASAPATLTVTVEPRPDPTRDPDVRGLLDAQAETVRRFGWTQLGNFTRRLEAVRSGHPSAGGLSVASGVFDRERRHGRDSLLGENAASYGDWAEAFDARSDPDGAPDGASGGQTETDLVAAGASSAAADVARPLRFWSSGTVTIGRREAGVGRAELDVVSAGISGGADFQLTERAVLGAGLGLGRDITDVGSAGSRSEASNLIGAAYFGYQPTEATFVDGVLGGGVLDFDLQRYVGEASSFTFGGRGGALAFGSLGGGIEAGSDGSSWSTYGRFEFVDAELDAHAEAGAGVYDLAYSQTALSSLSSVLGARASFVSTLGGVPARPSLRVEWRHEFQDSVAQSVRYTDWATGPDYLLLSEGWARDRLSAGVGLSLAFERGWMLDVEGGAEIGDSTQAGAVSGTISKRF